MVVGDKRRKILELGQLGFTNSQICSSLGMPLSGLNHFLKVNPDVKKALTALRSEAISNLLESSLLRRAVGYVDTEVTEEYVDDSGVTIKKVTTKTKTVPPDVSAIKTLANKYCKELNASDQPTNIKINLTANRSMSLEERRNIILADARPVSESKLLNSLVNETPLLSDSQVKEVTSPRENFTQNLEKTECGQKYTDTRENFTQNLEKTGCGQKYTDCGNFTQNLEKTECGQKSTRLTLTDSEEEIDI